MNPSLFRLTALSAALLSSHALAVGFGEISLLSSVGEPLRAEVPILANAGEAIDTACFSLATLRGSDLPVVSSARIRLARSGQGYRLYITGTRPISEPMFMIGLRANCGVELQRDYILMPPPPMALPEGETYQAAAPVRKSGNFQEFRAREGDTLESIAETQASGSVAEQRRLLAAMKRANPGVATDQPLAENTAIRIPNTARQQLAESEPQAEPPRRAPRADSGDLPPRKPKKPAAPRPAPVATPAAKPTDRVVLGAPPEEAKPGEKAVAPHAAPPEMEDRMQRLENTLDALNQEVNKLNSALALATEALAAQQKLQSALAQQAPAEAAVKAAVPTPQPTDHANQNNWLELLLSALVGGGIAAGLAQFLSRRSANQTESEMPLAINGYRHEVQPRRESVEAPPAPPPAPSKVQEPAKAAVTAVDIPLEEPPAEAAPASAVNVEYNDGNSALELAEIMLSFGRIRGAAETLAMHIEENSPDNIQPWTMLLDLYRRGDMKPEFDKLAARMRTKFNVLIPTWEFSTAPVSGLKSIEDYAHVVWRITNSWGTKDCLDYLYELVHDNRQGTRSGFPLEVIEEIALLMHILDKAYGLH